MSADSIIITPVNSSPNLLIQRIFLPQGLTIGSSLIVVGCDLEDRENFNKLLNALQKNK